MAGFDAVFVGSGINSLAGAALLSKAGWNVCVLERERRARRLHPHVERSDRARLHARGARVVAPALHRLARVRRAEAGARPARGRVPEHGAPDRRRLPGRLGRVRHDVARGQRRRARAPRRRGRRLPGRRCSTASWPTPTCRSACSARSSGRRPVSASDGRRSAASVVAGCSSTSAAFSRAAATGSATRSSRTRRTVCSRRGCSTPASAPTRRRPAS